MACMEHNCRDCPWVGFDNYPTATCPKCGGECVSYWDEELDQHDWDDTPGDDE